MTDFLCGISGSWQFYVRVVTVKVNWLSCVRQCWIAGGSIINSTSFSNAFSPPSLGKFKELQLNWVAQLKTKSPRYSWIKKQTKREFSEMCSKAEIINYAVFESNKLEGSSTGCVMLSRLFNKRPSSIDRRWSLKVAARMAEILKIHYK